MSPRHPDVRWHNAPSWPAVSHIKRAGAYSTRPHPKPCYSQAALHLTTSIPHSATSRQPQSRHPPQRARQRLRVTASTGHS